MANRTQLVDLPRVMEILWQKHQASQWNEVELLCRQTLDSLSQNKNGQESQQKDKESYRFMVCTLGESLSKQKKLNEAIWLYQKSIEVDPCFDFQSNLGAIYREVGQWDNAAKHYQAALEIKPNSPEMHVSLGEIFTQARQPEKAAIAYQKAISLKPDWAIVHYLFGNVLADMGEIENAILSHQKALEIQPDLSIARFGLCMNQLPRIYSRPEEILYRRNQYENCLEALTQYYQSSEAKSQTDSIQSIGSLQPFYLAYQGLNDKQLQQQYGQMICQLMANHYPQWNQPINASPLKSNEKIRIGFVSRFFYNHSNWKIPIRGWIENINKSEFELFGYYTGSINDSDTIIASQVFDKFCQGHFKFTEWAEQIKQDNLHILIFPEFGMDPVTVKLGCLRLAPVQATSWGHPNTSGLPTIDYYLSSDLMEPSNAQDHYTEKLLTLPNLSIHYTPLKVEKTYTQKSDIGLEASSTMYWCCQSLFKYLPQHDDVFPKIAQKVPLARFVFIKHSSEYVTQVFRQRLAETFRSFDLDYQDFCVFLERMTPAAFSGVASIADVFLDSMGWSGCNSTLESVTYDIPIVTMPGELMRSRHTMAILDMLGIREVIALTKEDYVNIAIRLGHEPKFWHKISQQIAESKHKLYGDLAPVRALEEFFRQVTCQTQDKGSDTVSEALRKANELYRNNHKSKAEKIYRELLQQDPRQADALLELGLLLHEKQQSSDAEILLRQATQYCPESVKAWFTLGNIYIAQGNFSEATIVLRQALALRPDAVSIYNNLGFALQNQGSWEEAIDFYQQALVMRPTCIEAEANLGNALHASGKLHVTQIAYYANLNYQLGNRQQSKGHSSAALSYFRDAMGLQPNFAEAELALGICLRDSTDQIEQALEHLLNVQTTKPKDLPMVYVELGRTYQMQGKIHEAIHAFREYLEIINPIYSQQENLATHDCADSNLERYQPSPITFSEIKVGDYCFPKIPLVDNNSKRPFWSVVIPAVNRPEYFPECLASVLAQWKGQADMEILVLDNGSEPPLFDIVNSLGRGIIRYVRLPKTIPLQENWNTMVALAQGEWIFLLQHDDYVLPDFFEQLQDSLEDCPESVGAAFTNYENIDERHNIVFSQGYGLGDYRGVVQDWIKHIGVSNPTSPPSVVIRRTAYEAVGGYKLDLPYTCDWELYMRVAAAYDWWHEPRTLAHYRQYSNSLTLQDSFNGVSGTAHRQAIEIAQSYLPPAWKEEIGQRSRTFHFEWCINRAMVAMQHQAWFGAMKLVQEALLIDTSEETSRRFLCWIDAIEMAPLKVEFSKNLFGKNYAHEMDWSIETIEKIRSIELKE